MVFLDRRKQRALSEDRVAGQQFQARIHREQFSKMLFQATRLVGFVAVNGPTGEVQFEFLCKNVEHEKGIVVFVFHLLGDFAVDGTGDRCCRKNDVQKLSEGGLEVGEREFFENTVQCGIAGRTLLSFSVVSQTQKLLELIQVLVGPSFDFGEGGDVGEESEKGDGENSSKGLGHTAFGAGIRHFVETLDEDFEGDDVRHGNLRVGKNDGNRSVFSPYYEESTQTVRT